MQLDSDNPWPGLESFEEDARDFFFGRDNEIKLLRENVLDTPVTVLYGCSGLGKTSLLQAGLFPALRERNFLPIYVRFELKTGVSLSRQLRHTVSESVRMDVVDAMLVSDEESLWEYLHSNDFELWNAQNYPLTPVIVLDQFEELFTLGKRVPDLVDAFRNELGDLAENRIPAELAERIEGNEAVAERFNLRSRNYKLLISLREDFLPDLEGWCRLIPTLARSRVRLLGLRTEEALDAVYEPAAHMMTHDLARRVVGAIAGENIRPGRVPASQEIVVADDRYVAAEVDPALLSLFCRELNEERKRRGQKRFDEQLIDDAQRDTLSNYYSSCIGDLPPRVSRFIETELITESGFRDQYIREDAVPAHLTEDELDRLISSRLVRLEDRYGAQRIELTHDVLTGAVREHRDRRRAREREAELEAERQRQQAELHQALERQHSAEDYANALRKRSRLLHAVLAGTAVIAVLAIVAAFIAVRAKDEATAAQDRADAQRILAENRNREALGQRLTSEAQAILSGGQPGSELSAYVKLIAAQHISPQTGLSGLLTGLNGESNLQAIYPASGVLSGDGRHVADVTASGLQLVDTQTWQPVGRPFGDLQWLRTGLSFGGRYLASFNYDSDKAIRVWDFDEGSYIGQPMRGTKNFASSVAVSTDGHRVAAEDVEGTVRLWDTQSGRLIAPLPIDPGTSVFALEFSPNGRVLATGGGGGAVRLWDAETGAALRETHRVSDENMEGDDTIESLAFSPDGSVVAAGGRTVGLASLNGGMPLRIWNADTGSLIGAPIVGDYGVINSLAFSPDGRRIVTGSDDETIQLWDAGTSQPIGKPVSFQADVWQVAFTREGNKIIAVSGDAVQMLDGNLDAHLPFETAGSHAAALDSGGAFGVDTTIATPQIVVLRDNVLRRLDANTGRLVSDFRSDALLAMRDVASSRDNRWLAIAGEDNAIRVLDTSNGHLVGKPLRQQDNQVDDVDFSPDGTMLASADSGGKVRLWDWRKGEQIGEPLDHEYVETVTFSEDGKHLFSRGLGSIWIWDVTARPPTGKQVGGPNYPVSFTAIGVSSDGRYLATGSDSGEIQQWDVGSGEKHGREMQGHDNEVKDVTYSPDGRYLVSVGARGTDDTLRFWDVASGRQIGEPVSTEHMGQARYASFSKDGHWIYVTSQAVSLAGSGPTAGRKAIWRLPAPVEWEHSLCAKLTANPSDGQWKEWVSPDIPYTELCPDKPRDS